MLREQILSEVTHRPARCVSQRSLLPLCVAKAARALNRYSQCRTNSPKTIQFCTALYSCTVLYGSVHFHMVLYGSVLHCTVLHRIVRFFTTLHGIVRPCTALYDRCTALYSSARRNCCIFQGMGST